MPASYLARHRPLCTVLQEIRELAVRDGRDDIIALADEATDYAQRMSAKLTQYKSMQKATPPV